MNHLDNGPTRTEVENDIFEQVEHEIRETLESCAPELSKERCESIVAEVLEQSRAIVAALTASELAWPSALDRHVANAIDHTKRRIRGW